MDDERSGGARVTDERSVLVTGASRGIGRATARLLAGRGHRVLLVARSNDELRKACDEIRSDGGRAWYWAGDVTQAATADAMVAYADEVIGGIDIAILAAGIGHWAPVLEMTDKLWRETMSINLDAVYYGTRAVIPGMVERGRGHLVLLSSVLGRKGVPNMAAYSASKAAVAAFAESVAAEVKPHGVKTTVVYPGTTATTMRDHQERRPKTPDITEPELQLAPEDIADAIAWAVRVSDRTYPTAVTVEPLGMAGARSDGKAGS